jgi:hypothetical protein
VARALGDQRARGIGTVGREGHCAHIDCCVKVAAGKMVFTRPLCPYPQVETYKGSGDVNDAANFICANPK